MSEPETTQPPKAFATVEEASAFLRLPGKRLYEACKRGEIPHVRIGRSIRIPMAALQKLASQGA